jgi:hypothetical protein
MRLTSTSLYTASGINVGIGTSSPAAPLEVAKNQNAATSIKITNTDSTSNNNSRTTLQLADSGGIKASFTYINAGSAVGTYIGSGGGGNLHLTSGAGVTTATLDSSGNLGLGVAPSAWDASWKALQIGNASFVGSSTVGFATANAFFSGGYKYVSSGPAQVLEINNANEFRFLTAPSGDAGNTIPFTQAMTLTANGNLGIGTSLPENRLALGAASNGYGITWENYSNVFSEFSSGDLYLSSNYYGNIGASGFKTSVTASFGAAGIKVSGTSDSGNAGLIQFFTDLATSKTAGAAFTPTERMRIDSAGNLGLGVAPSAWFSATKAIQIGNTGAGIWAYTSSGTSDEYAHFVNNSYINSSSQQIYVRDGQAAQYRLFAGNHSWFTAPSGTAGDPITFNQAMTLDASGNLLVGTTSAANPNTQKMVIKYQSTVGTVNSHLALVGDSATNGQGPQILFSESGDGQNYAGGTIGFVRTGSNSIGDLVFGTRGSAGDSTTIATERMRIDSSGQVLIGNTTAALGTGFANRKGRLHVGDANGSGGFGAMGKVASGNSATFVVINNASYRVTVYSTNDSTSARIGQYIFIGLNSVVQNPTVLTVATTGSPNWTFSYSVANTNDTLVTVAASSDNQGTRIIVEQLGDT